MVTYVRGAFKNVQGTLDFDPENPRLSAVQAIIDATGIWTGEPQRDAHLRSADFLDVENHPQITFKGDQVELSGEHRPRLTHTITRARIAGRLILFVKESFLFFI
jgi:polyisoprenoid-binding protein YceI